MAKSDTERKERSRQLDEDLKIKKVIELIKKFKQAKSDTQWAIGDALQEATEPYAREFELDKSLRHIAKQTDYDYTTVARWRNVAKKFATRRRFSDLTWSHHKMVASKPDKEADALLSAASDNNWSTYEFQKELYSYHTTPAAKRVKTVVTHESQSDSDGFSTDTPPFPSEDDDIETPLDAQFRLFHSNLINAIKHVKKIKYPPQKTNKAIMDDIDREYEELGGEISRIRKQVEMLD